MKIVQTVKCKWNNNRYSDGEIETQS